MRSTAVLTEARQTIVARREMHARAVVIRKGIPVPGAAVDFNCRLKHRGGKSGPKCAEVYRVSPSLLLFISRPAWRLNDQLHPPPWEIEHLLGAGLSQEGFRLLMEDDQALDQALDRASASAQSGRTSAGDGRWLRKRGPVEIVALVTPDAEPPVGLWVRCPAHPGSAESLSRQELFDATRLL